ncbi:MAG: S8 family serine peptidase [Acidimicrobiia bacterium]|nr:S8 family serine peptidase [Acidimicrobiia bacterium]
MTLSLGRGSLSRARIVLILLTALATALVMVAAPSPARADGEDINVIVTAVDVAAAEAAVAAVGGDVAEPLAIIGGFSAVVPADGVAELQRHLAVSSVVEDGALDILDDDDGWEDATGISASLADNYAGSLESIVEDTIEADDFWKDGYYGDGVDVALIDSGVVPVQGLTTTGKVINGPDLSFESQSDDLRYMDTYGHGTHLAGIIAGDDGTSAGFRGVAPGARIINVKVANYEGAVDVSQVIAAIDWVVQHKNDNGMNIRVLNLAYGTDSTQSAQLDPLAFAVEQAWRAGIVVVVASGNDGNSLPLRNPALQPHVIAVGASDSNYTASPSNDYVAGFTNCGTSSRHIDVLAPGRSIISLRNPGSSADVNYPEARIGDRLFLGSGTSQASAVVSGAAALMLSQFPDLTPNEVKAALMETSREVAADNAQCAQAGLIDLDKLEDEFEEAEDYEDLSLQSSGWYGNGSGSLEGARGSHHVAVDGVVLEGEQDIFGKSFISEVWAKYAANYMSWDGGDWNGTSWSGTSWSGTSWSGTSWSGTSWSGTSWSGTSWSDYVWSGTSWSGTSWSGTSWSGTSWSGTSWSGTSWSDSTWLGLSWG